MTMRATSMTLALAAGILGHAAAGAAQPAAGEPAEPHGAVLKRYCLGCHNQRLLTAGLALDTVDVADVGARPDVWEKVARKLRSRTMPPRGRPRPDGATYDAVAGYLEAALDRTWAAHPNSGRPAVQRLNRSEYVNAVRDLLALEVDGRALLPADESGYGFDNIGDVLSVSPGLLERYILAAAKISRWALGDPTLPAATALYKTSPLMLQDGRVSDDLPFGSRGGHAAEHHFPLDAEYVLRVRIGRGREGSHALEVRLDRERVATFPVGRGQRGPFEVRLPVQAGTRLVGPRSWAI